MGTAANVILGPATLSIDTSAGTSYTDVGFTRDGVTVRMEREYRDVMADQIKGSIQKPRISEKLFVATTLLEATLTNLMIAWDQPTSNLTGTTSLTLGYDDDCVTNEVSIQIVGFSPSCGTRTFTIYRAVAISEAAYAMKRDEESAIPVEFECLKDPDNSDKFGTIVDS